MSKAYLGAFVAIAAVAVGAVDYINQAKAAGTAPGRLGVGDYVASISDRFVSQKAAITSATERQTLQAMARRDLLPEPPEGWTRHEWDDATADVFGRRYDMQKDDFLPDEIKNDPTMKALSAMDEAVGAQKDAREVFVYETADAAIALRLQVIKPGGGGISGAALQMVANKMEAMSGKEGFAIIKGVTFREEGGLFGAGADQRDYRVITGQIGKEMKISVRAKAGDTDIVKLLNAIDYDRLNRMLEIPVAGIGSAAQQIPESQQRAEADRRVQDAAAKQRIEAIESQYRMQAAALELSHRLGSVDDANYAKGKAALEEMRAGIGQMTAAAPQTNMRTAALAPPTSDPAAATMPDPASAGGLVGSILGAIGFGAAEPALAEATPITPANAKSEIKVNAFGAGTCKKTGLGKRCSIGN
jgi:hypothetical protein